VTLIYGSTDEQVGLFVRCHAANRHAVLQPILANGEWISSPSFRKLTGVASIVASAGRFVLQGSVASSTMRLFATTRLIDRTRVI